MANELSVSGTLVAATAQTVTLGANYPAFLVTNEGTDPLYVTTDGTVATAGGTTTSMVGPNATGTVPNRQGEKNLSSLSLYCAAAQTFIVSGVEMDADA